MVSAKVERILIDEQSKKVAGVEMSDGTEIKAKVVVSDVGLINTATHLLPSGLVTVEFDEGGSGAGPKLHPSQTCLSLFVGLHQDPKRLNLPTGIYYIHPSNDLVGNFEKLQKMVGALHLSDNLRPTLSKTNSDSGTSKQVGGNCIGNLKNETVSFTRHLFLSSCNYNHNIPILHGYTSLLHILLSEIYQDISSCSPSVFRCSLTPVRVDFVLGSIFRIVSIRKADIHRKRRVSHKFGTSRQDGVAVGIGVCVAEQFIFSFPDQSKGLAGTTAAVFIEFCPQSGSLLEKDIPINSPALQHFESITIHASYLTRKMRHAP
jgi:hypothetical protein